VRDDHNKIIGKHRAIMQVPDRFYGVGIGPGDPKLLTIRAKEILDAADTIFVPKAKDDGRSCARSIVEAAASKSKKIIELTFPMTTDQKKLESHWLGAARRIVKELKRKRTAAFVTIGDPFIYSTYIYLIETLRNYFPGVIVETIPGVTSFNAAAASCGLPLLKGNERLAILPAAIGLKDLRPTLKKFDTVVLMKIGSRLGRVIRLLKKIGLIKNSILVSHVGQAGEKIIRDLSSLKDERAGYLSVIIVKRKMGSKI